jgi:hypothetical protein
VNDINSIKMLCHCGQMDACLGQSALLQGFNCKIDICDKLSQENGRLHAAILNQCGDNLCWITDPEQAKALPEAEFLESCKRYRDQIASGRGEFLGGRTIAQLEARVLELERNVELVAKEARDAEDGQVGLRLEVERHKQRIIELEDAITDAGLILSAAENTPTPYGDIQKAMRHLGKVMNDPAILKRQGI